MPAADSHRETAGNKLLAFGGEKTPLVRSFFMSTTNEKERLFKASVGQASTGV